ncbi:MAG: COX15/CtaA family protein [Thermoanaerobaculaceae bacterium]
MQRSLSVPLAFAAAVAMWAVGYLGRFPGVGAPPAVLGILFLLGYLALGGVARGCGSSPEQAALAGSLASLINLLVLGSLLAEGSGPSLAVAIPGSLIAGGLLAWLGWRLIPVTRGHLQCQGEALFSQVAVVATFLLVVAGGLVTSQGAGLAVPDWPNTFGSNMFFFPLSRMTGGVYYEHAHRLFGSLVGLTTVSLAVYLSLGKRSSKVRGFAWLLVVFVVVQGILGGLRVTGRFTISQDPELLSPSTALAVAHGILGQLFLSGLVAQAVWLSHWRWW